ncbi:type II secretion system F family protein [Streptomyces sp. P01-B04]|uniref:type II secretion system F family protein n=1 Tax=Streptomyces poriferorum TaxID=2798799 RepID=UPI001C5E655D|nr:type II secretion system F family protein [Streptomyces poriferorum]MBW5250330.1 type II secretion system F family protein [Streptomyces poriferorum]MBW5260903.1 type II secretion system F family protein [Streptomyces poriferorum]
MSAVVGEVVHRLGVAALVLGVCVQPALALARRRTGQRVRRRGLTLLAVGSAAPAALGGRAGWPGVHPGRMRLPVSGAGARRWAAVLGAVLTGWFLVGGPAGWAVGLAAACGTWRWQRVRLGQAPRAAAEAAATAEESMRQLPLAADLLAACISAGAGPREAAEAVGESLGGPVGEQLARTAAEIRLGGDPAVAWGRFGAIPGAAALARCLDRAGSTGAPAAESVARLAEAMRAERTSTAVARAQRAAVLITAPLGLCFLPAFLTVGVAPVVIGLAGGLLQP